jgi:hypothetical protein
LSQPAYFLHLSFMKMSVLCLLKSIVSVKYFTKKSLVCKTPIVKVDRNKKTVYIVNRTLTTFKLEGEVTSLSGSSQGEVEDNREKWEDLWEKLIVINRNIVLRPL